MKLTEAALAATLVPSWVASAAVPLALTAAIKVYDKITSTWRST